MSAVTFTRHENSSLYLLSDVGCANIVGFYLIDGSPENPAAIPLREAWEDVTGFLLFMKEVPDNDDLATALASDYSTATLSATGLLWLDYYYDLDDEFTLEELARVELDIHVDVNGDQTHLVAARAVIDFGGYRIPIDEGMRVDYHLSDDDRNGGGRIGGPAEDPPIAGYPWGGEGHPGDIANGFVIQHPADANPQCPDDVPIPAPDPFRTMYLMLTGANCGALQCLGIIGDYFSGNSTSWDVALRYVVKVGGSDIEQFYPVFDLRDGRIPLLWMCWYPCDQLNPERTYVEFLGKTVLLSDNGGGCRYRFEAPENPELVATYFRTVTGERIGFALDGASPRRPRLVFEIRWHADPFAGEPARYYLVPSGEFELAVMDQNGGYVDEPGTISELPCKLLCGLAGVESVEFRPRDRDNSGDSISFFPHRAAYAPAYPVFGADAVASQGRDALALLTCDHRTSWVAFRATSSGGQQSVPVYYAQPEQGPLYKRLQGAAGFPTERLLGLVEPIAHVLPAPLSTVSFPVAPVAGAKPSAVPVAKRAVFLRTFEEQVLSPIRRETILRVVHQGRCPTAPPAACPGVAPDDLPHGLHGLPGGEHESGMADFRTAHALGAAQPHGLFSTILGALTTTAATPQGLIASITPFGWSAVRLARNAETATELRFEGLNTVLQAAFQTNQLFMVATSPVYLQQNGTTFFRTIRVGEWRFDLDLAANNFEAGNTPARGFADLNNTVIFKFGPGRIVDRIKDTKAWTNPRDFSACTDAKLALLAQRLTLFVDDAIRRADQHPQYARFKEIVEDPDWTGILGLNISVNAQNMPTDLQALAAGVDWDNFVAHHIAIETGFIQLDAGGTLVPAESSIAGLIDYVQPPAPNGDPAATSDYYFVVREFRVWFYNATIRQFHCTAELTMNRLFDEVVAGVEGGSGVPSSAIRIVGTRELQNGQPVYSFNLEGDKKYLLESAVLDHVLIRKAQFSATAEPVVIEGVELTLMRCTFAFFGHMAFRVLQGAAAAGSMAFDMFSFDKLAFENLALDMEFYLEVDGVDFSLATNRMSFDLTPGATAVRTNSLVKRFPMKMLSFIRSDGNTLPANSGYVPVRAPVRLDKVEKLWYGLDFELNIGGLGEFAANAGIVVRLLLAWSPGGTALKAQPWLKFPGVNGAANDLLTIEGVVKLGASAYELRQFTAAGVTSYLLMLKNFALRVLGVGFPTGGGPDIYIFGDPNPPALPPAGTEQPDDDKLGWFGVYKKPVAP